MKETVLVSGGAGYIGSHTTVELVEAGYDVVIVDNLSNSEMKAVEGVRKITGVEVPFEQVDCTDKEALSKVFDKYKFNSIIHFAASKAVGESVQKPLLYYRNNLLSLITILELMRDKGVRNLVFSSSCTVYGQPETYREQIRQARLVACAGCYPTSILVPTLPLLKSGLIEPQGIIADSLSGVSGAGRKADLGYIYCECNESARPYGIPKHRHLSEIEQELSLAAGEEVVMQFTPHLIPLNRGILTTLYLNPMMEVHDKESAAEFSSKVEDVYRQFYDQEPFIRIDGDSGILPDIKNVVMSNVIELGWKVDPRTGRLLVLSTIDNLMRGASGQAVQCMNLMMGLPETTGLM